MKTITRIAIVGSIVGATLLGAIPAFAYGYSYNGSYGYNYGQNSSYGYNYGQNSSRTTPVRTVNSRANSYRPTTNYGYNYSYTNAYGNYGYHY